MTTSQQIAARAAKLLSLDGKTAMVTGGASGIGRAICLRLAEMGSRVAVLDIDEQRASHTVDEIHARGGEAIAVKCDVRSSADCRRCVEAVIARWGKVDILCNCAGIAIRKDVVDLTEDESDRVLDITLKGIYLLSHEVIPHMIRDSGGSIVNIGSGWSLKGGPKAAS